jgi:hypothetical protein
MKSFFALLRYALWGTPLPEGMRLSDEELQRVMRIARMQSLNCLVANALLENAETLGLEQAEIRKLHAMIVANQHSHRQLNTVLAKTVATLEEAGIASVLLKGQGAASSYPVPELRMCGDIDLYVGPERYREACEALRRVGSDAKGLVSDKHWHTTLDGVEVEVHRKVDELERLFGNSDYRLWWTGEMESRDCQKIVLEGQSVTLPPVTFNAFFIFHHAWHHFLTGGVGLRQLCDWARHLYRYHGEINENLLGERLLTFGQTEPWKIFGCIVVEWLGLPEECCPFYDVAFKERAAEVLKMILKDGNFGQYSPVVTERPAGYFAGKAHSFMIMTKRLKELMRVVPNHVPSFYLRYVYTGVMAVAHDKL